MSPFTPAGEQARWLVIYGLLRNKDVGDILTYDEMGAALELDPDKDRTGLQLAMRRAAREFEVIDKHAIDVIPNIGYRVVEPKEHLRLAQRHQRKSGKALARGASKVQNIDFQALDDDTRRIVEVFVAAFAAQADFNRRMDVRQNNLEQVVAEVTKHTQRTTDEIAHLHERLRRLENKTPE